MILKYIMIFTTLAFVSPSLAQTEPTLDCTNVPFNAQDFETEISEVSATLSEASRLYYWKQPENSTRWMNREANKTYYRAEMQAFRIQFYDAAEKFGEDCPNEVATHFLAATLNRTHERNMESESYQNVLTDEVMSTEFLTDVNAQIEKGAPWSWTFFIQVALVVGGALIGATLVGAASLILMPIAGSAAVASTIIFVAVTAGSIIGGRQGLERASEVEYPTNTEITIPQVPSLELN